MAAPAPADPAAAPALAALHADAFPPAERWDAAAIATLLALPGGFGLVDARGGMILARVAADEAEVLTLAVHPAARRQGIGRLLLLAACERAGALGAATMFLEVSERNAAARALYVAAGFAAVGRRREYYPDRSAALVMRKSCKDVTIET